MALENTFKGNCDIKSEPMDPENGSGQAYGDLETTTLDLIKSEYINEGYSDVKVEEDSIDTTLNRIKDEYINECYSDVNIVEHSIDEEDLNFKNYKDSCHIIDNKDHLRDDHVKDEETLNTHVSAHIRESIYSCNTCNKNFDQNSQFVRHLKTHTGEKNYSCNQCGKCFSHRKSLASHIKTQKGKKNHS